MSYSPWGSQKSWTQFSDKKQISGRWLLVVEFGLECEFSLSPCHARLGIKESKYLEWHPVFNFRKSTML